MSVACSSSTHDDCTCVVEHNGERRLLACGGASCVGSTLWACAEQNRTAQRGPCTVAPPSAEPPSTPDVDGGSTTANDSSCDDLRAFCITSCSNPASVSADC